jgi:hypothetical protein
LLLGQLSQRFLGTGDFTQRLAAVSDRPDANGLYPVNEFHCLPQAWPDVVGHLAPDSDVVLIDLRRLRAKNTGALFEVALAIQRVPLDRILLLVDRRTDGQAVVEAVERAWQHLPQDSPNAAVSHPRVRQLLCEGARATQYRRIREAVFSTAFDSQVRPDAAALSV